MKETMKGLVVSSELKLDNAGVHLEYSESYQQLLKGYMDDCNAFAMKRGFPEAVGHFMSFEVGTGAAGEHVDDGKLAAFVEGLGSKAVDSRSEDVAIVKELSERYSQIAAARNKMLADVNTKCNELLERLSTAVADLRKELISQV